MMLPMPFFTHMGIPYNAGTYGVSVAALPTCIDRETNTEFNFNLKPDFQKQMSFLLVAMGYLMLLFTL